MPLVILISSLLLLYTISYSKELFAIFTSGVSMWHIVLPIVCLAFCFGIIATTIIQPISALLLEKYDTLEAKIQKREAHFATLSDFGIMVSETYNNEKRIVIIKSINIPQHTLSGVTILFTDQNNNLRKRVDAPHGKFSDGALILANAVIFDHEFIKGMQKSTAALLDVPTSISTDKIRHGFKSPEYVSFWNLKHVVKILQSTGISTSKYQLYYWKQVCRPLIFITAVLLAACFTNPRSSRKSTFQIFIYGITIGFFMHIATEVCVSVLTYRDVAPIVAVFSTIFVIILLCMLGILYLHET